MNLRAVALGVLALVAVYGLIEARPLLLGPTLTVSTPKDAQTVEDGLLRASGTAQRAARFTLNGEPVLPDQTGRFSTTLALSSGTSILTFTAADRFGRTRTITRTVYVP